MYCFNVIKKNKEGYFIVEKCKKKNIIILLWYILLGRWLVMFDVDFGKEWWILFFIFCIDLNMNGLKYGIYIFLMKLDFFGSFNLVLYWGENKIKNDFVLVFSIFLED